MARLCSVSVQEILVDICCDLEGEDSPRYMRLPA